MLITLDPIMLITTLIICSILIVTHNFIIASLTGEIIISVIAKSILLLGLLIILYASGKLYCAEWKKISAKSYPRILIEKVWVPVLPIISITDFNYINHLLANNLFLIFSILSYLFLYDIKNTMQNVAVNSRAHVSIRERKAFYISYPPRSRFDILPLDLIYFAMSVYSIVLAFK